MFAVDRAADDPALPYQLATKDDLEAVVAATAGRSHPVVAMSVTSPRCT